MGIPRDPEQKAAEAAERGIVMAELERLAAALDLVTEKIAARVEILSQHRR